VSTKTTVNEEAVVILEDRKDDYHLKVTMLDDEVTWYMNGQPIMFTDAQGSWPCYQLELSGVSGKDNKILVGGLGFGFTSQQAEAFGPVTTVEILQSVVDLYRSAFPDQPLHIVVSDFCDYIKYTDKMFDYILLQLDFVGFDLGYQFCIDSNKNIYTKPFMSMLSSKLNENGVFVTEGLAEKGKDSPVKLLFEDCGFFVKEERNDFSPLKGAEDCENVEHVVWICTKGKNDE
tara:strand:+ start:385 stop:1080 length:696 start_codon:yes stop_codon:yes gene_type:complete